MARIKREANDDDPSANPAGFPENIGRVGRGSPLLAGPRLNPRLRPPCVTVSETKYGMCVREGGGRARDAR